tara:strand:- start:494 stop:733 length:240 start_codon:yes stop_codon:yes gene_type:complete
MKDELFLCPEQEWENDRGVRLRIDLVLGGTVSFTTLGPGKSVLRDAISYDKVSRWIISAKAVLVKGKAAPPVTFKRTLR